MIWKAIGMPPYPAQTLSFSLHFSNTDPYWRQEHALIVNSCPQDEHPLSSVFAEA